MNFIDLAQDMVETISELVGGRIINFMNCSSTIIASTEKKRIGTFHQGAEEVLKTGKAFKIRASEIKNYRGVKEGYNMPIFYNEAIIGVVGVFGNPDEIEELANLIKVYVTQLIKQDFLSRQEIFNKENNAHILRLLIKGVIEDDSEIIQLCSAVEIKLIFPVKIYFFIHKKNLSGKTNYKKQLFNNYACLEEQLLWRNLIVKDHDVYGVFEDGFLWVHRLQATVLEEHKRIESFLETNNDYLLIGSRVCKTIQDVPSCFKEMTFSRQEITSKGMGENAYFNLEKAYYQQQYFMQRITSKYGKEYIQDMYLQLIEKSNKKHIDLLLETGIIYFEERGSVTKAAERVGVHKNTLLYRLKQLYSYLGLEEAEPFTQEFFIRLLNQSKL